MLGTRLEHHHSFQLSGHIRAIFGDDSIQIITNTTHWTSILRPLMTGHGEKDVELVLVDFPSSCQPPHYTDKDKNQQPRYSHLKSAEQNALAAAFLSNQPPRLRLRLASDRTS